VLQVYYFFQTVVRARSDNSCARRSSPSLETSPATTPFASFWATLGRRSAMAGKSWLSDFAKDGLPNAIAVSSMDY
jgi:hypothetical protein